MTTKAPPYTVAALYKFAPVADPATLASTMEASAEATGLLGLVLVAHEGVNGTIAGTPEAVEAFRVLLYRQPGFDTGVEWKTSTASLAPFRDFRAKIKPEIVTLRVPGVDPTAKVGTYLDPEAWNDLISQPDVVLVDTRNRYEYRLGTFEGAVDCGTQHFTEFPAWIKAHLDPARHRKVAMFCTGGIRCEKATSLMLDLGFEEVYHLQGGILRYLEEMPEEKSKWHGECFVFDRRVALTHGLKEGQSRICGGCGLPVTAKEQQLTGWRTLKRCIACCGNTAATPIAAD